MKVGTPTPHRDVTGEVICIGDLIHSSWGSYPRPGIVCRWSAKRIMAMPISTSDWDIVRTQPSEVASTMQKHIKGAFLWCAARVSYHHQRPIKYNGGINCTTSAQQSVRNTNGIRSKK